MTRLPTRRPARTASLATALLLAGAVLAGCGGATPPAPALPVPAPARPPSEAALCGPKPFGAEQPPEAWVRFDVTEQQVKLIGSRLVKVLCRGGLWRQGVGYGVGFNQDRTRYFVMIHPGHSGLTARQVLDRLLGRGP
jgi:hypothetical protein